MKARTESSAGLGGWRTVSGWSAGRGKAEAVSRGVAIPGARLSKDAGGGLLCVASGLWEGCACRVLDFENILFSWRITVKPQRNRHFSIHYRDFRGGIGACKIIDRFQKYHSRFDAIM